MNSFPLKRLTVLGLFAALSLAVFAIESVIPPLVPIPGIKLGLANIITLIVISNYSNKDALLVLFVRIVLSSLFFGQAMSFLYSLAGGLLCLLAMGLANRALQGHFLFLTSIFGAIFHNLGQIGIALLLTSTLGVLTYLPFLIISGIVTGLFTGLCAGFLNRYLRPLTSGSQSVRSKDDGSLGQSH